MQKANDEECAIKAIRVRKSNFKRLQKFGQTGEPLDRAITRILSLAERHIDELPNIITQV